MFFDFLPLSDTVPQRANFFKRKWSEGKKALKAVASKLSGLITTKKTMYVKTRTVKSHQDLQKKTERIFLLVQHIDIVKCEKISLNISVKNNVCDLEKVYLFCTYHS